MSREFWKARALKAEAKVMSMSEVVDAARKVLLSTSKKRRQLWTSGLVINESRCAVNSARVDERLSMALRPSFNRWLILRCAKLTCAYKPIPTGRLDSNQFEAIIIEIETRIEAEIKREVSKQTRRVRRDIELKRLTKTNRKSSPPFDPSRGSKSKS